MAGLRKTFLLGFLYFFIVCSCSYYSNSSKATSASQADGITDTLTNNLNVSPRATTVHETYSLHALKWCAANKATNFNSLRELILLEEFKNCLPEKVVVYLNEQKVTSISHAAVLADEFILIHKNVFLPTRSVNSQPSVDVPGVHFVRSKVNSPRAREDRECFIVTKEDTLLWIVHC